MWSIRGPRVAKIHASFYFSWLKLNTSGGFHLSFLSLSSFSFRVYSCVPARAFYTLDASGDASERETVVERKLVDLVARKVMAVPGWTLHQETRGKRSNGGMSFKSYTTQDAYKLGRFITFPLFTFTIVQDFLPRRGKTMSDCFVQQKSLVRPIVTIIFPHRLWLWIFKKKLISQLRINYLFFWHRWNRPRSRSWPII